MTIGELMNKIKQIQDLEYEKSQIDLYVKVDKYREYNPKAKDIDFLIEEIKSEVIE